MGREIEFRGKDVVTKEWVYGDLIHELFKIQKDNSTCIRKYTCDGENEYHDVIPETIGQYTGLKDKNGKKIFEGDIIHHDSIVDNADYVVEYKESLYCGVRDNKYNRKIYLKLYMAELSNLEVIGNIYEKELKKD